MTILVGNFNLKSTPGSLYAQLALSRNEAGLATVIRNLSTGIRIHSGRDDPSGFVSSSILGEEIAATQQAVANCNVANTVCSAIDGAVSQINSLLNEIRGLVTNAANSGANNETITASLQLQVDACLDSIDRIANTTSFKGQFLLDGSLDFTTYGVERDKITSLQVNQADFLGATEKEISVKVLENAQPALLLYQYGSLRDATTLEIGGNLGYYAFDFDQNASIESIADAVNLLSDSTGVKATVLSQASTGNVTLSSYGADNDLILTASQAGTQEGNFVVKFVAPPEGNSNLSLNVVQGTGNEPTSIEVLLATQEWVAAAYHYNGENDGIPNNEFNWVSKIPGTAYNDIDFKINNVNGTADPTGIVYDLVGSPKTITLNVDYNALDPANTTVNDLQQWLAADPILASYFAIESVVPSDGTGPIIPTTQFSQSQTGIDGGAVLSTAEQVAMLLNTSPLLQDAEGNGLVSASIPTGTTGLGVVSPFQEYAYFGSLEENNQLQFLGPKDSPNIRFNSTPGTALSVDYTSYPPNYGHSSATVQGLDPNTTFSLRARGSGDQYDGLGIILQDGPLESAVLDPSKNAVIITVDFSGREADPSRGPFDMLQMQSLIESSPSVGSVFEFVPQVAIDKNAPATFENAGYLGIDAKMGEMSGGLIDQGLLVINLETDVNGNIRTTAADLVKYFDKPTSEEAKAVLGRLGISVSLVDPNNTAASSCALDSSQIGLGYLNPTFSELCPGDPENLRADIVFTSEGADVAYEYPSTEVLSQNGRNASFAVTGKVAGPTLNNTAVQIVNDPNGLSVKYNPTTKKLIVAIDERNPPTANEVIDLINADASLSKLFSASHIANSDGTGVVAAGDRGVLTGGVKKVTDQPGTVTTAKNGIDSVFQVTAKQKGSDYDGVAVLVVENADGPVVSYDPVSKQLSIGISSTSPPSAAEIVALINGTAEIGEMFLASIPEALPGTTLSPNGTGAVRVGDGGTLHITASGTVLGAPMIGNSDQANVGLAFLSTEFGSEAFVSVQAKVGTGFSTIDARGITNERASGSDVLAMINNQLATGKGKVAYLSANDLDVSIEIGSEVQRGEVFGFRVTGGGALMQLGPSPNSYSQARIAFKDMHTAKLGGASGFLNELRSGGAKDLSTDTAGAYQIVEEVIKEVSFFRGRIGAFQKDGIERTTAQMSDLVEAASEAESYIRDTDFALASSELTRLELLMQADVAVLKYPPEMARQLLGLLQ